MNWWNEKPLEQLEKLLSSRLLFEPVNDNTGWIVRFLSNIVTNYYAMFEKAQLFHVVPISDADNFREKSKH